MLSRIWLCFTGGPALLVWRWGIRESLCLPLITRERPKCADKQATPGHKASRSVMNIQSSCTVLIRHYMKNNNNSAVTYKPVWLYQKDILHIFPLLSISPRAQPCDNGDETMVIHDCRTGKAPTKQPTTPLSLGAAHSLRTVVGMLADGVKGETGVCAQGQLAARLTHTKISWIHSVKLASSFPQETSPL